MASLHGTQNCGVKELHRIQGVSARQAALDALRSMSNGGNRSGAVVFTDTERSQAGPKLADFIRKNGLGVVVESPFVENSGTGNNISVYVWTIPNVSSALRRL